MARVIVDTSAAARMAYERVIPVVQATAQIISSALRRA